MVNIYCSRCKKNKRGRKRLNVKRVGKTQYIRIFLKTEQGWSEEQINSAIICSACRCFIYQSVFTPHRISHASKNAFPRSQLATVAAAESVAKQLHADIATRAAAEDVKLESGNHVRFWQINFSNIF